MNPILSICIPTYNRAHLLEVSLRYLAPQAAEFSSEVELIVSDNCSTDNTPGVVAQAQRYAPIRYHRNGENIGAARNVLVLTDELALGEFCWILGDDDFVREGGIRSVMEVLKKH